MCGLVIQHLLSMYGGRGQSPKTAKTKLKEKKKNINYSVRVNKKNRPRCHIETQGSETFIFQRRKFKTQYAPKSETLSTDGHPQVESCKNKIIIVAVCLGMDFMWYRLA